MFHISQFSGQLEKIGEDPEAPAAPTAPMAPEAPSASTAPTAPMAPMSYNYLPTPGLLNFIFTVLF